MKTKTKVHFTARAERDADRCRKFLRRKPGSRPIQRIREVMKGVRIVQEHPKLNPVQKIDHLSGLQFRRHISAQFAIVYVYFDPTPSDPHGLISVRAIRHAGEEDVFFGVREQSAAEWNAAGDHFVPPEEIPSRTPWRICESAYELASRLPRHRRRRAVSDQRVGHAIPFQESTDVRTQRPRSF